MINLSLKIVIILCVICSLVTTANAQKKIMQHSDKALWNKIKNTKISNSGAYVIYALEKGEKDKTLYLKKTNGENIMTHKRVKKAQFTYNSNYVVFSVNAYQDSITKMKRRKVKKANMPKDSLVIYNISKKTTHKIPNVKSYELPQKWSGIVTYMLHPKTSKKEKINGTGIEKDSLETKPSDSIKTKKVSKKNGFHLVIRQLSTGIEDTLKYVLNYKLAKKDAYLTYITTGESKTSQREIYHYNAKTGNKILVHNSHYKTKFPQLGISETGKRVAFVVDTDSTKSLIKKPNLYAWQMSNNNTRLLVASEDNPERLLVSADKKLWFSKNEERLFFGLKKPPIVKDTTLLDDEIVNVEVWTYDEPQLYTVQEQLVKSDKKKAYTSLYDFKQNKLIQIANPQYDIAYIADEGNCPYAVIANRKPYLLQSQWTIQFPADLKRVNLTTGETTNLATKVYGVNALSPKGNYLYGYSRKDSTWYTYNLKTLNYLPVTKNKPFYDELNDYPNYPRSYGAAGWTQNDEKFIINDRFDIWAFDFNTKTLEKLTNGRKANLRYRYITLDNEEKSISKNNTWLLSTFNEETMYGGFANYNPKRKTLKQVIQGPYRFGKPIQAQLDKKQRLFFTKQSFTEFPNLWTSTLRFKSPKQLSNANPQQNHYNWGTAQLVKWVSLDGKPLKGMLIKPEDFNPNKKYPMIVNFYEKSSHNLYRHRAPSYGRSTINYAYYASRGYLIFNPDVHYREGYPGESALNCVLPGITALIDKGFVDKANIGLQGHSWGGYQAAYLVTKTNIFKAAESGAPVPNMLSAYGGIRWATGLSRQFQYEHTQSRLGGTPWEYPQRYIENSPIFNVDKISTPLLIMHNDADGHVPWYQGIELFMSLRRLGKPAWFLNYNNEPHWPLKKQNRKDFNLRMSQFFDYYLKDAPKPLWMHRGVPALEKGINQGYEYLNN